jgi:hypothetical protein
MDIQRLMKFLPPSLSLNFGSIYNPIIRVRVYNCGEGENWLSMVESLSPIFGERRQRFEFEGMEEEKRNVTLFC